MLQPKKKKISTKAVSHALGEVRSGQQQQLVAKKQTTQKVAKQKTLRDRQVKKSASIRKSDTAMILRKKNYLAGTN